jgi:uncharacterized protein YkwD
MSFPPPNVTAGPAPRGLHCIEGVDRVKRRIQFMARVAAALISLCFSTSATGQDLDSVWLKLTVRGTGVQIDLADDAVRRNGVFNSVCYMRLAYDSGLNVYESATACEIAKNVWSEMNAAPSFSLFSNDGGLAEGAFVHFTNRSGGTIEGGGTHILTPTYSKAGKLIKVRLSSYGVLFSSSSLEPGESRFVGGYTVIGNRILEKSVPEDAVQALAPHPPPDSSAAPAILALVNAHRASGAVCGTTALPPALPLSLDSALNDAAALHAVDMAQFDYFSHIGRDGSTFVERIQDAGFSGVTFGENIAAGLTTVAAVVSAWMGSSLHCSNIMNPAFDFMGAGHATVATSTFGTYWVQTFGGN